ncbi:MAG: hypothetical protein ABI977_24170 [Acidobacteriota bacterium]
MTSVDVPPSLTVQVFVDEFGAIDACVYEAALILWPRAERDSLQMLHNTDAGQRLLMKACALVTRKRTASPEAIENLPAYLYQTWRRLVLEEMAKENHHRQIEEDLFAKTATALPANRSAAELDRRILLQQIIQRMDDWTRRVFEYLTLGFTFDEIAHEVGGNGHAIRVRYDRQVKLLTKQLT